jgi:hypothetical protein
VVVYDEAVGKGSGHKRDGLGADSVDHVFDEYFDGMVVDVNDGDYGKVEDVVLTGDNDLHYSLDNEVQVCYN